MVLCGLFGGMGEGDIARMGCVCAGSSSKCRAVEAAVNGAAVRVRATEERAEREWANDRGLSVVDEGRVQRGSVEPSMQ